MCSADAEDAVQEALTRALERIEDLDPTRVDGWLKTVTMNICRDMARDRGRHGHRVAYQLRHTIPEPFVDESVVERAYAASVADHLHLLPGPQQLVLRLRADAMPVEEIAGRLGMTMKSAESLLSRGRRTMRAVCSNLQTVLLAFALRRRAAPRVLHVAGGAVGATALAVAIVAPAPTNAPPGVKPPHQASAATASTAVGPALHRAHAAERHRPRSAADSRVSPSTRGEAVLGTSAPGRPVRVPGRGVSRRQPDESFLESVKACLRSGVTVSSTYVGCNAAQ
jgi:RNA polymerase sigma factor (sigma-70 family)